ncbi:hypothetical protein D0T90_05100 [Neisseria animalis]|uniref:Uncharacterized protein n=1 Tax=Neisseria animalis TaxID=492 RepID=A0A5P3MT42_NEIAN|nr:hypothetical protein D0T90_05100 [Neisseria animalis]ROW31651.1 hypothetical protein CGZ60_09115 [Neisseria animalis]
MPCRTMCTVCSFAALSHSYFIRLYNAALLHLARKADLTKPVPPSALPVLPVLPVLPETWLPVSFCAIRLYYYRSDVGRPPSLPAISRYRTAKKSRPANRRR